MVSIQALQNERAARWSQTPETSIPDLDSLTQQDRDTLARRGGDIVSRNAIGLQTKAAEAAQRNPAEPRNFFLAGKALVQAGRSDLSVRWFEQAAHGPIATTVQASARSRTSS